MSVYPIRCTFDDGRFIIEDFLGGSDRLGLYRGRERESGREVVISFERLLQYSDDTPEHFERFRYETPGVAPVLFIGPPDRKKLIRPRGHAPMIDWAVIELRPRGVRLCDAGRLDRGETVRFGIGLAEMIRHPLPAEKLRNGLHPETVFVDGDPQRRHYAGATPRALSFLLNFDWYSPFSHDRYNIDFFDSSQSELVRQAAMLMWYAHLGEHPFAVGDRTQIATHIDEGVHRPFTGPPELGRLLEAALVPDPARRIPVLELRDGLVALALAWGVEPPPFPPPGLTGRP